MNGCKQCPAFAKCTVTYRGSACAALRSTYGADTDPEIITNADRIRAMSDDELAELFYVIADKNESCVRICNNFERCKRNNAPEPVCQNHYLDWLRQPAKED